MGGPALKHLRLGAAREIAPTKFLDRGADQRPVSLHRLRVDDISLADDIGDHANSVPIFCPRRAGVSGPQPATFTGPGMIFAVLRDLNSPYTNGLSRGIEVWRFSGAILAGSGFVISGWISAS